ncbi:putative membrane protein DUF2207 [Saccharopolyspora erythraea NRRL 2338]|uniref:Uncharacterized protein n=2 Tax=Saccharopolyspora erythraea TaxID=1836 RepID=A4F8P1_SACEN|nr:hypothetical protein N599_11940 [Saccharopolyspora erythraea D]PFG94210.1 putative membrane protein DUF2207 [Saccharopolyspora erythraea NRRL 2338]QRK90987.1 DUF2207 domain-containing protein [Saccharopolyspora erythraea]CAM00416.1 hypothetical protein SACE_1084 [Saccharopolyspora erythraea NRRL 2338]
MRAVFRKRGLTSFAAALTATLLGLLPGTAFAQEQPVEELPGTVSSEVDMKLERDGRLSVTERINVPEGAPVHRRIPLRQPAGSGSERVFTVSDARVDGPGTVDGVDRDLAVTLRPGVSTLTYVVGGAVADAGDVQDVRWQVSGGWDVPVDRVEVSSFLAPKVPRGIECLAGEVGTTDQCDRFEIGHTQSVRALTFGLAPGERVDLLLKLPAGTVPANAVVEEGFSFAHAFSLTPATGAGLTGIGLLLVGAFGLLWYTRGRDARLLAGDAGPVEVLMTDSRGGVTFASPDGVLPGQIGTVIDERVDVVDVTSTVVDLAVRNYLWIEEQAVDGGDWRIVAVNAPDDSLRPYERAVHELVLPHGRGEVRLSQLRGLRLTAVREHLYTDVVDKGWFARRPDSERNLFWWGGIGLTAGGVALTAVLALTSSLALLGVGVVLGGVAMTFGAPLMPARTERGSALVAQVRGLRDYLHGVSAESLPVTDRETVFSRSLPYAVVLGEAERWLEEFAELDPGADGTPGLYWYGEFAEDGHVVPNLRRFRSGFPRFVAALNAAFGR